MTEKNLLGLDIHPQKRLAFLRAKGHARYKFRALNKPSADASGKQREETGKGQEAGESLYSLPGLCVCVFPGASLEQ